jgi:hypothetical protein
MSMQKLAFLADPISTFYKVGIIGLAKKVPLTTHNTTNTTTTTMSRRRPTLIGFAIYCHSNIHHGPNSWLIGSPPFIFAVARRRVHACRCWFPCLGRQKETHQK